MHFQFHLRHQTRLTRTLNLVKYVDLTLELLEHIHSYHSQVKVNKDQYILLNNKYILISLGLQRQSIVHNSR